MLKKETVLAVVNDFKAGNMPNEVIEDIFKNALKVRYIGVNEYAWAMEAIYGDEC